MVVYTTAVVMSVEMRCCTSAARPPYLFVLVCQTNDRCEIHEPSRTFNLLCCQFLRTFLFKSVRVKATAFSFQFKRFSELIFGFIDEFIHFDVRCEPDYDDKNQRNGTWYAGQEDSQEQRHKRRKRCTAAATEIAERRRYLFGA